MNRKQYLTTIITFGVLSIGALVSNMILLYTSNFLIITAILVGYLFIKYRVDGSLQYFSARYNMLLDYDLEVEQALEMAKKAYENAPTPNLKESYALYVGMAAYYCGRYDEAIKTFNTINLARLNPVFHALVFSFTAYSANELKDDETFDIALSRLEDLVSKVPNKYQGFVLNYKEVLEGIKNMEINPEGYKEMVEKHFSHDDGYLARKLNYQYRLAYYYQITGDIEKMDQCLAFCIANGKEHHIAKRAKEMFTGTCNPDDFIFDPNAIPAPIETVEEIETVSVEDTEDKEE